MPRQSSPSVRVSFPTHSREELLNALASGIQELFTVLPVERVVLFGSRATGRHTASSDIDLLVIYSDPPRDDAFSLVRKMIAIRGLEPHVYARSEADRLRQTISRMTRDGVNVYEADSAAK